MHLNTVKKAWFVDYINVLPYSVLFLLWGSNVFLFAVIYTVLSHFPGQGPTGLSDLPLLQRFANSLYYSVITATNTGYGDIVPIGYSRFFAATQSVTELFLFALFVSKLVSNRQDVALEEVHRLSFELTFRNIREDFFVARKDFDIVIHVARKNRAITDDEYERLTIAYQHIVSLLNEIPNFYDITSDLYIIDPRREALLLEAVQRTTSRINEMLDILNGVGIEWNAHADSRRELAELFKTLNKLILLWEKHSHNENREALNKIADAQGHLRMYLQKA